MNKRTIVQFTSEYFVDLFALFISNLAAALICMNINKIPHISEQQITVYTLVLFISNTVVYIGFASSLNLSLRSRTAETVSVLRNCLFTYLSVALLLLLTKNDFIESRYQYLISLGFYIILSAVCRYILKRILINSFSKSKMASLVGVVTIGERAEEFIKSLQADWTHQIAGVALLDAVCENGEFRCVQAEQEMNSGGAAVISKEKLEAIEYVADVPVVANSDSFMDWIRSTPLDEVFINIPYSVDSHIDKYINELESMGITVHVNISTLENVIDSCKSAKFKCGVTAGYPIATFAAADFRLPDLILKRMVDIIGGFIGSVISVPIILLTAIPLKLESKGPLIFKQQRIGKNGRVFNIYKLRSMYMDAEERKQELMNKNKMNGLMFKMDDDPRITKVGKFIRATSIDELPQFWNVLKGDMSLIGTRPPTVDEFVQYESHHKRRLSMRPGITGMWQVSGRSDIQDFEEIVKLDCQYIDNWSVWLDIKILFKTIGVVLKREGAE